MKFCRECGIKLTNLNWHNSNRKQGNYVCKSCYNAYKRKLKIDHKRGIKRRREKIKGYYFYPTLDGELIAKIPLTQNEFAVVDIDNADKFSKYEWQLSKKYGSKYAKRKIYLGNKTTSVFMHTDVLGKKETKVIDHINHDGLYNKRKNLRFVVPRQNSQNQRRTDYSSRYPGVCRDRTRNKWMACYSLKGKSHYIGRYSSEEEAYKNYLKKINKLN